MKASIVGSKTDVDSRTVRLRAGETLLLTYAVEVERGALSIDVRRAGIRGIGSGIWYQNIDTSIDRTARVTVEDSGTYEITLTLRRFGGTYDITWKTE